MWHVVYCLPQSYDTEDSETPLCYILKATMAAKSSNLQTENEEASYALTAEWEQK